MVLATCGDLALSMLTVEDYCVALLSSSDADLFCAGAAWFMIPLKEGVQSSTHLKLWASRTSLLPPHSLESRDIRQIRHPSPSLCCENTLSGASMALSDLGERMPDVGGYINFSGTSRANDAP
jgi:hypothetical protein